MAKTYRCPRPVNRLVMMRTKNALGPFFQNAGAACVKPTGNFYAPGMPGSGPQAIRGEVMDATRIHIVFTQCISHKSPPCVAPYDMTLTVKGDPDVALTIVSAEIQVEPNQNVMLITVSETIQPGDEIVWSYDDTNGCLTSCDEPPEEIGDQGPLPVHNPLELAGDFILLETGGVNIILEEQDTDETQGLQEEQA